MGEHLVRNLEDRIIDTFRYRAQVNGTSLEHEVREILKSHARLTPQDTGRLFAPALKLCFDLDHVVYDCIYLALARQLGVPLITADKRLAAIAPKGLAIDLEDWRP